MENNAVREESMERCEGLENWLTCARCPYICTNKCPLEGADAGVRISALINVPWKELMWLPASLIR
jgi:hypothetical protein